MPLEKPISISDIDLGIIGEYWEPGKFMLDYDGSIPDRVNDIAWILGRFNVTIKRIEARQTKRGYHVIVYTNGTQFSPVEVTCLQALMGSDFKRETFNLARAIVVDTKSSFQMARWQVLFQSKLGDNAMSTLREVSTKVAIELTSPSDGSGRNQLMKWPQQLVILGQELKNAASQDGGTQLVMRHDVLRFAQKMAATMDIKDEEKGRITESFTLQDALRELQIQYDKLREEIIPVGGANPTGLMNPYALLKRLIHIANFCMVTHNIITKPTPIVPPQPPIPQPKEAA